MRISQPNPNAKRDLRGGIRRLLSSVAVGVVLVAFAPAAIAKNTAFSQSLAVAAADDAALAGWYQQRGYQTLWTGAEDAPRRAAFFAALEAAADHGLPVARYDLAGLRRALATAQTHGDLGRLEIRMSRAYLDWASDMSAGALIPAQIDKTIVREISRPDPVLLLDRMAAEQDTAAVLRSFIPTSDVYVQLMKARFDLEAEMASGGWGNPVPSGPLVPGDQGERVVALRDRLIAMGWMRPNATAVYDRSLQAAVMTFQKAHGLPADGVAGGDTLAELNKGPEERIKSVLVAMERERWLDIDRTGRMIWVNLPDYSTEIIDDGRVTFRTRSVIGREDMDRRTPEFSDMMDHMVVNPSWGVPRSIIVGEYLPLLRSNPNAVSHMQIVDRNGRVVSRGSVNFASYTARTFPFGMRQPPGDNNALGKVKFMFPNKHNIYLHDTPAKALFAHDKRAYSHGCIRLADPFDFAHALFRTQSPEIEAEFNQTLKGGRETPVKLQVKVPIHLVYFTAYPEGKGVMGYRRDVYGRDAKLWSALSAEGVVAQSVSQ
ncbi:L,D-transpeptidase family protein [Xinfangfangia sp. D13-10-4-6]|uniref:L,D-transpeptidase family protein n=1 Tax=Pseudogemmobacter hezensis TaxID=2737662 RepID=UPI001553AE83|nr:L,D-transpeptidase family protein [Pseudogemmobacter hezensis]NPD13631.1 L,D-transpeptidase family protein [Pseudogemmobacter hezensis]